MKRNQPLQLLSAGLFICILLINCREKPAAPASTENSDSNIEIRVDPRVELFSTIHRLAATGQYDAKDLPGYINDIEAHFGSYRDHRAVQLAIKLHDTHNLDGNSPMTLAVYLTNPPELKGRSPLIPPPEDLDSRWTADTIPLFLEAAREFARDTAFMSFFQAHQEFYVDAVNNLRFTLKNTKMLAWFEDFFGYLPENYVIILGLQNGTCNYGSSVTLPDGKQEFNSLLGANHPDKKGAPQYPRQGYLPIIVHEFCHSYVNPLIDRHSEALRKAGEVLFPYHEKAIRRWGYNHWFVMLYEYLTRACVIRYLYAEEGQRTAKDKIKEDERAGFPGIQALANVLAEFEEQRERYPTLETFMSRLVTHFNHYAKSFQ